MIASTYLKTMSLESLDYQVQQVLYSAESYCLEIFYNNMRLVFNKNNQENNHSTHEI